MRSSRWLPVAGWCLATATSIVLSSVALLPVLNAARADPGALPDFDQPPVPASSVLPIPGPSAESRTPRSPAPSSSRPARPVPTSKTPTRKPSVEPATIPPATTEDGWTVTESDDGKTYVRSFRVDGGQVVIKVVDGVVSLVTATPADGYSVEKVQNSPDNLAVYFIEAYDHHWIVHVTWNGAPNAQITEVGS